MENAEVDSLSLRLTNLETEVKNLEQLNKKRENEKPVAKKFTLETTLLVAIIGLIGSYFVNSMQAQSAIEQKKFEFQSTLITSAVEAGDSSISRRNLKFLLDVGLIDDPSGKISKIVLDSSYKLPSVPNAEVFQCRALSSRGERCRHMTSIKSGYCYQHYPSNSFFVTKAGKKYHLANCRMLNSASEEITIEDAKERGLEPCKICKPG